MTNPQRKPGTFIPANPGSGSGTGTGIQKRRITGFRIKHGMTKGKIEIYENINHHSSSKNKSLNDNSRTASQKAPQARRANTEE
jgi:hypothetical protein